MTSMLEPILSQLKTEYILIFVGIMAVCAILAIIKKAVKVGIIVIVLALAVGSLAPMATEFQKDYKFEVVDGQAHMYVKGEEYIVDRREVKTMELENKNGSQYKLIVYCTDGDSIQVLIPSFMRDPLFDFADQYGLDYEIRD